MQSFPTPEPVAVTIEANFADVQIAASDRSDTVVDVRPTDPDDHAHVEVAEATRVEMLGDQLRVIAPKPSLMARIISSPSLDITITVPTGSAVRATLGAGNVEATGTLGACKLRTGAGTIRLGDTGPLEARSGTGDIVVRHVAGDATIETPAGHTQIASATGNVEIKNGSTGPRIGVVGGDLTVRAGHGRIEVESVAGNVDARTAHGAVVIGRAAGADVDLRTSHGDLEVGIPDGRAAWLDLDTKYGRVVSEFVATTDAPSPGGATVRVVGHTSYGDIRIRRISEAPDTPDTDATDRS
jgi:Putative adhesin